MASLSFNPMAIADVGSNPRKLAAEILTQMRAQLSELPLPVPLREIAGGLGIRELVEHASTNFLGALVIDGNRSAGIISLQRGLQPGRRNFTLGHEIGHFVSLHHQPPPEGFQCASEGIGLKRAGHVWATLDRYQRMEIEANEFSAAVLVPLPEYRRERGQLDGSDLDHLETLRIRFGVSKEMMARIYVDTSREEIAIVLSQHGRFVRCVAKKNFPHLGMRSQTPVPQASITAGFVGKREAGFLSNIVELQPEVWLENTKGCETLTEQVLLQKDGRALTLLTIERSGHDDDDEGSIKEAWAPPRFAYGR